LVELVDRVREMPPRSAVAPTSLRARRHTPPADARTAAIPPSPVAVARRALLEGVGAEVAASFPGITRVGGQVVAALYLDDDRRPTAVDNGATMDALASEIGCAKSNIFQNLRALETAGIVERRRVSGSRQDRYALAGPYPDVMIGAYVARLRRMVGDKRSLVIRALALLGDAEGGEADALRAKLHDLGEKYALFGALFKRFEAELDGPIDLEPLLRAIPEEVLEAIAAVLGRG
jgi:DNA-binding transcriptional regulator GbsR (MarR family)